MNGARSLLRDEGVVVVWFRWSFHSLIHSFLTLSVYSNPPLCLCECECVVRTFFCIFCFCITNYMLSFGFFVFFSLSLSLSLSRSFALHFLVVFFHSKNESNLRSKQLYCIAVSYYPIPRTLLCPDHIRFLLCSFFSLSFHLLLMPCHAMCHVPYHTIPCPALCPVLPSHAVLPPHLCYWVMFLIIFFFFRAFLFHSSSTPPLSLARLLLLLIMILNSVLSVFFSGFSYRCIRYVSLSSFFSRSFRVPHPSPDQPTNLSPLFSHSFLLSLSVWLSPFHSCSFSNVGRPLIGDANQTPNPLFCQL